MTYPSRFVRSLSIGIVVLTSAAVCTASMAASAGGYLNWSNKLQPDASAQTGDGRMNPPGDAIHTSNGSYPVPASPYGQVGDPFARSLRWPTKAGPNKTGAAHSTQVASQMPASKPPQAGDRPSYQPMPQAPVHGDSVTSISTPIPLTAPRTPQVVAVPQPEDPGLADDPGMADAPTPIARMVAPTPPTVPPATSHAQQLAVSRPLPAPQPSVQSHVPPKGPSVPGPATAAVSDATALKGEPRKVEPSKPGTRTAEPAPVLTSAPAPVPTNRNGAYQVPATSKYAARIDSARAAQAQAEAQAQAKQTEPVAALGKPEAKTDSKSALSKAAASKGKSADQPTPPEPTASLASQETDHVFIPGERATDASDEPRFYSLHRQYGIKPDPITVDHDATGALLGINGIDAVEGGDPNNDHDSTDSAPKQPDSTPR